MSYDLYGKNEAARVMGHAYGRAIDRELDLEAGLARVTADRDEAIRLLTWVHAWAKGERVPTGAITAIGLFLADRKPA
jgi:hypothetical protein